MCSARTGRLRRGSGTSGAAERRPAPDTGGEMSLVAVRERTAALGGSAKAGGRSRSACPWTE
ncbi:hypothetical protein BS329_34345 [Amycolatopsis coloradensis]|uniref:Uncharacterized protein n=1 Tax=Amycolatopsis coloradensis TaxID=76021 RepID=A0A1R0KIC1_9PSEU|nr:hypothetical protein [Amycolatopsis coloradensis]OLZ45497.1 hypothetical protein BS329_34345 [Amycolatopsis coloradensis]